MRTEMLRPNVPTPGISLLLLLLAAACVPRVPPPVIVPPQLPAGEELLLQQEMLAFAYVAYAGELLKGSDDEVERQLVPCVERELREQPLLRAGDWQLAWGPAVFKFALDRVDDNMLYVARSRRHPHRLVISTRGTNETAILSWVLENTDIHLVDWAYGDPPSGLEPKISGGTHRGLTVLQQMEPAAGVPGAGLTLRRFLAREVAKAGVTQVDVTGHSLGGALAPTLALWLADTRSEWDPESVSALRVVPFAGATAGNADFAAYSDQRIGDATHRVHHRYDIVPMAWNRSTLAAIPEVYAPEIEAPEAVKLLVDGILIAVGKKDYRQIRPDALPLPGTIDPGHRSFTSQLGWQHTCGYLDGLKVRDRFQPVLSDCSGADRRLGWPTCLVE